MTSAEILAIRDISQLRYLNLGNLGPRDELTWEEYRHIFKLCDALWLHSGNPTDPHAELTSGKCSDGFIDTLRVLCYPNLCQIMAMMLVRMIKDYRHSDLWCLPDWVIGSDHAGATLSFAVAGYLNARHDFTSKGPDGAQIWNRFEIQPGERVLQVEELVTTTKTLQAVRDGIIKGNPHPVTFSPVVMTLVHRSDVYQLDDETSILYCEHYDIQTWDPTECPLCAAGSKRLRPKQNWAELTGKVK